jgi:ubiquinone/menaquinone biosynthesis C-methylase UbiE
MATSQQKLKTQNFYDRIAEAHHVALKVNGYRKSVANYLRSMDLRIDSKSTVLDAGSGTGIVTLGFYSAGFAPKKTYNVDLSHNSLKVAREQFEKDKTVDSRNIRAVQGNVLSLPFTDESFDLVLTCGVLEYVPLNDGMKELARVLKPGGKLVLLPVKPSLVGSVLKILYKFKIHSVENVKNVSQKYFKIVGDYKFPLTEPMGWSKMIFLLEKK